jgi:photosystem II stability/assembly factor-like uncharacterized protein
MMRIVDKFVATLVFAVGAVNAPAQWAIQNSNTNADLRGIHSVDGNIAWASGTNGTVLRTVDGGSNWQACAVPPGAEKLDFRGVQAFDAKTAIVMSSGKGDLSRLYKTTDGCRTWRLVFTNPDKDGFWDAIQFTRNPTASVEAAIWDGVVVGDPVNGRFAEFQSQDSGEHWEPIGSPDLKSPSSRGSEAPFAASNSSVIADPYNSIMLVTGGKSGARSIILSEYVKHDPLVFWKYVGGNMPLAKGDSAGAFSVARATGNTEIANTDPRDKWWLLWISKGTYVAVGGDYRKPESLVGTAAYSTDSGLSWHSPQGPPHGYRSAVAYDAATKTWITVGPNGTDISTDDGKNWRASMPDAALGEAADADRNWNALSLPFVVGPKGRIGKLNRGSGFRGQGSEEQGTGKAEQGTKGH